MLNKKTQATIAGEVLQLWYNKYGLVEFSNKYGITNDDVIKKIQENNNNNVYALFSDIIYMGRVGYCLANGKPIDVTLEEMRIKILDTDESELINVWKVFIDAVGANLPEVKEAKKKIAAKKKASPRKKKN